MTFRSRVVASLLLMPMLGLVWGCGGGGSSVTPPPITNVVTTTTLSASPTSAVQGANVVLTATVTSASGSPTGGVAFLDGTTPLLPTATLSGGVASITLSSLAVGTHSITANYGGNTGFTASASTPVTVTIIAPAVATTTVVSASPNPASAGAPIVLSATTTATAGTATGTVTFFDGTTSLGSGVLNGSGVATLSVSTLAVGSHSITASYAGAGSFTASASAAVPLVISAVTTTTSLTALPNPAAPGANVVLTATTTAASGTATGTVTFFDGATSLGTGVLNGSGVATLSVSTLAVGSHSITASYAGVTGFTASTSPAVPLVISAITTTTTLTVSPNPASAGANVVLTATTTAASGTAAGTVTFYDGATSLGTGALNGSGVATLTVSTLAGGSHSLTASYAASGNFGASTSAAVALVINQNTTTTVSASPNPAAQGASVVLTATTTATSGTPGGSVTFYDGATSLGTGTLNGSGVATLSVSTLAVGSHSITTGYAATSGFLASTSTAVPLVINAPSATSTALSASPNPASQGANVVLNASTTSASGTPIGTVTFYDGATSIGTASLSGGTATLTVTTLALGTHSLTASYGGGSGFAASTSTAVSVNITVAVSAHGSFTFTTANQTIMGFGGAEAFYQNYLSNHPNASQIYTALFDPVQGLGLNFLRLQNNYFAVGTGSVTTSNFDPDAAKIMQGANTAAGTAGPVSVLLASWTPPAAIKSNNNTANGGTLKMVSGAYDYADFATYWHDSVVAYTALGVTPNYISIQNEPDFTATYVSCRFNPTEAVFQGASYAGYDKALDAVYKAVQALPTPPKMIGPESFSTVNLTSYADALEGEPTQSTEIYALAHHLYNVSSGNSNPDAGLAALQTMATKYPTLLKFETEYFTSPGFLNAWNIHNALAVGNDNAYIYWGLTWPSALSGTAPNQQATDQQGLMYIDNPFTPSSWVFSKGWAYNDAYYAMKHFSYFIRPGYVRYNASVDNTDERVSVYQSPDKKTTVIVAMNVSTTATDTMSLDLSGVTYTNSAMYRSTFSTPISTGERWATLGVVTPTSITLAPQAVVTIVLSN
jgi:O-glycosyl hydrolase